MAGASISSALPGWAPGKLIDNNTHTTWSSFGHSEHLASAEWAAVQLPTPTLIDRVRIYPHAGPNNLSDGFPKDFVLQASYNDTTHTCNLNDPRFSQVSNWKVLVSRSGYTQPTNDPIDFSFTPPALPVSCVRLFGTALSQDGFGVHYMQLSEIQIFERFNVP